MGEITSKIEFVLSWERTTGDFNCESLDNMIIFLSTEMGDDGFFGPILDDRLKEKMQKP